MKEKIKVFKYLSAALSTKINWVSKIGIHLNKAEKEYFMLTKYFCSKLLFKKFK